jgi:uncharacterized membrane protein YeaQ/YmgE (transglycosylase-associated protein family)
LNTAAILLSRLKNLEDKMHMSGESLLVVLVVGLIAGWLAGQIVQGTGFGIVGDLLIGIAGAFIGSWLLPQLGLHLGSGIVLAVINATIGQRGRATLRRGHLATSLNDYRDWLTRRVSRP